MNEAVASSGALTAPPASDSAKPRRPPRWEERAAKWLFMALSPRLPEVEPRLTPAHLEPFTRFEIARSRARGRLVATWYPAADEARGAVLLVHPWVPQGQAYFHRRGRLEALTTRAPDLPVHLWGVSAGGYWSHPFLSRHDGISGAFFEDVACHLIIWAWRMAPRRRLGYLVFQVAFRRAYRYFDLRRHAPRLRVRAAAYVGGASDRGARPEETRELARLAAADLLLVPGANHLEAIKRAGDDVVGLALATFRRAEHHVPLHFDTTPWHLTTDKYIKTAVHSSKTTTHGL